MDLTWFRDLGNLSRTGNFSQAAELSNISQPAFSRRIKALEAWVGSQLVDRSRHPVNLTAAGLQMLEAGEQAISRIAHERAQILEAQSLPDKYVVTFGAQHSIGWRFYPAWLQAFEGSYGPIMSRLRADDLPSCIEAMEAGEVDFVIAYESRFAKGVSGRRSLDTLVIGNDEFVPVSKADSSGEPLFDLNDESAPPAPYLRFGTSAPISQHIDPLLDEAGIRGRLGVVYENAMAGALRIRAREGSGVAWLPRSLVAQDLEAGLLAITGGPELSVSARIQIYRLKTNTNKLTRDIWTFLATREKVPLITKV